ncbi:MAG: disulfide reductase [candidate division Zixibacteria bacterium]|nr:disulfide reductase [candidate division Zixibacteria bacterium]
MTYVYFPGCSLTSTGRGYHESLQEVCRALEVPIQELEDWNCCGATSYMAVDESKAFALSARNLALAERLGNGSTQMMVPCAACYLGLNKAQHYLQEFPAIRGKVDKALAAAGLAYSGRVQIRHPLDIFIKDIGRDKIAARVAKPLAGLKVACYYGCQLVRPYAEFDDQHNPTTMETIMTVLGAEVIDWPLKTRCCGGSLTGTIEDVGLRLSYIILTEAQKRGADLVATACPLCQFNLECYQGKMNGRFGLNGKVPVAYFTQLMGLAFGLSNKSLGLNRLFVPLPERRAVAAGGGAHVRG